MIGNAFMAVLLTIEMMILAPFFSILIIISLLIPPTVETDISQYETYRQELNCAVDCMPTLDALGEFEELRFGYQETSEFIFCPKTMSLTVKYDAETYDAMKQQVLAAYNFIDAPIVDTDGDILLDDSFTHKGYDFLAVPVRGIGYACKFFVLIGVNEDLCCIAWLYYDDVDLDVIARPDDDLDSEMRELIDDYFHWQPFTE